MHRIFMSKTHHVGVARLSQQQMDENVYESAKSMMSSATFGQVIILIVYIPILALVGIEGKMFRPMAQVVVFALVGAAILSLTYVPMISALFLSKKTEHKRNLSDRLMDWLHKIFNPVIAFTLRRQLLVSVAAIVLFLFSLFLFTRLGGEFIPQLEEGDLAAGVMTLQGGSLTNTIEQVEKANKILLDNFPEIIHAVCKIGAAEIPTDPTPMETGDYIITLTPKSEWVSAESREELVEKMEEKLIVLAGVKFEFQQPIQMRFNELMTGSKQDIAIKIFGDDLNTLAEKASDVERIIQGIEGVEDINVEKVTGLAQVQVEYNRDRLAQYGLSVKDVNAVLRAAFAGSQAGIVFDEEKRFGLVVRLDKDYRQNLDDVRNLSVALSNGTQIPFEQVASIEIKSGPAQVSRENTKRRITIGFNVRNRDVQSVIAEVSDLIDKDVQLPTGYYVTFGGQFQNLEAAMARLTIALPAALLLIFVMLFFTFHSVKQAALIFTAVPMSIIGGVLALWVRDMNFSISAGVGFIALFGVAVLNGIVLIAEFNRLEEHGVTDIVERVKKGLHTRLRPVIVTAAVASLGFLPMALSASAGAEVQRPLATVVIGGLITATFLTLVILPVFYIFFSSRSFRKNFAHKRMKNALPGVILLAGTSLAGTIHAQQPATINTKQAIQQALDNNMLLRSSLHSVDMQKALIGASWDIPKTTIDGEYGRMNSYTKDNSFTLSQSFAFPSVYINQYKLAKANVKSSEWQLKASQLEIATQVKQVYWQLSFFYSKHKLLLYQDSLYAGYYRAAELRVKAGETNRLEMMTARSQSMEVKNKLQQVISDLSIYNQNLQTLLNADTVLYLSDTVLQRINYTPISDSLMRIENPSTSYMTQLVEISRYEKKVERSRLMPDFSVGYFSQTMQSVQEISGIPRTFEKGDRFAGIQAGIAVPLWVAPFAAKAKAARLKEQVAQTNAEYYSKKVSGNYHALMGEYSKCNNNLNYYEKQAIPEADLIIEQATRSYKSGAMDYLDYMMSLSRALSIKQSYLEALNDYNQTIINIEFITGKIF
jgi:cobalt-zinc-cadmium resistance protein CzcA